MLHINFIKFYIKKITKHSNDIFFTPHSLSYSLARGEHSINVDRMELRNAELQKISSSTISCVFA